MKVIYSESHLRHDPPHQFNVDRLGRYSESPDRALNLLAALRDRHDIIPPTPHDPDALRRVHSPGYLMYLEGVYAEWETRGGSPSGLIPYTFNARGMNHVPVDLVHRAGHYCFDPQTPIVDGTWEAARTSADCALTGADALISGDRVVYALCRPPGHHASGEVYGGYCYLNNAALAAEHLDRRVAIVDIDYHHGNGTQTVFYDRDDVLFVSLHADPERAYPFYSGASAEVGIGPGVGANRNVPLPAGIDDRTYIDTLEREVAAVSEFSPDALIVSAGFDIHETDPLGDFAVTFDGLRRIGAALARLDLPTLIVQEGGYDTGALGRCALEFLSGFESG